MKEVLIINAHQKYDGISEGRLNKTLALQAKSFFREHDIRVSETIIDQGYDVDEEVEKHLLSDLIVLQTPINWSNPPWSYKKYADDVTLNYKFYGYEILPGYHCFDVVKNPRPEHYFEGYGTFLNNTIQ